MAPVNLGVQNFCGTSQFEAAEFLRHQSIWGRRISAAPVGLAGCRISVAPSSPGGAEFLRHYSILGHRISVTPVSLGCRISAAPVSLGVQNFYGTSQYQAAEFLRHQLVYGYRISGIPVSCVGYLSEFFQHLAKEINQKYPMSYKIY